MPARKALSVAADRVLGSPVRNFAVSLAFVGAVFVFATLGYVHAGWPFADAVYMVAVTIFSVGYDEVRPVDTGYLRALTMATIGLGCTGLIVLTGTLIQVLTDLQLRRFLGTDRMQTQIDHLNEHVIICGFGRIGLQLSAELSVARSSFVIIERDPQAAAEAEALGYFCLTADATDESALHAAGIDRARVLATVLPDDAANVFITLSARSMNPQLQIIARGEAPTTESKLAHAGADKVVLPTHTGAERIAELILYPATATYVAGSPQIRETKRSLHEFGLELEAVEVAAHSVMAGATIGEAERAGQGSFFIVQLDRANGQSLAHPADNVKIEAGDHVVLVVRGNRIAAGAVFTAARAPQRTE